MREPIGALAAALARRPGPPLALALLLAAGFLGPAIGLGVDPGNEAFYLAGDPALEGQRLLDEELGGDELIAVALEGPVLEPAGLDRLEALHESVEDALWDLGFALGGERKPDTAPAGAARVLSLVTAKGLYPSRASPAGVVAWAPWEWMRDGERTDADGNLSAYAPADFAREVTAEPLFAGNLVAADGRMAAIVVTLDHRGALNGAAGRVVSGLREAAAAHEGQGFSTHVAGYPVERYDFAWLIDRDQRIFVPLIVAMIALVTALLFRQVWGVLLPLGCVGLSVLLTTGVAAAFDVQLNAVTSLLRPVIMVVSVAASVNLCMAYGQARGDGFAAGVEACREGFRRVGPACLFTTLTTALGFGALALSDVPAIRQFGLLCALGVAVSYAAALLILPAAFGLAWVRGPRALRAPEDRLGRLLGALGGFVAVHRRSVLVAACVLAALAAGGIARLRVETDILGQLPARSALASAVRAIEARLGGVNAIELLFEGAPGAFRTHEALAGLARAQAFAEAQRARGVEKTFSIVDVLASFHEAQGGPRALPADTEAVAHALALIEQAGDDAPTRTLLSRDASIARLTVRLRSLPASQVYALLQDLEREARPLVPEGIRVRPAGGYVLIQNMTHHLPRSQLRGLMAATALILAAIALLFRSLALAAVAALPACVPVAGAYGLMGWAGIDLSTATSMIASVALGLAVDATILILARYRDERAAAPASPRAAAVERALASAGHAVAFTTLTLVAGFAVGALSSFPPVRDFAVLTAATLCTTGLAALFVLPALILSGEPREAGPT